MFDVMFFMPAWFSMRNLPAPTPPSGDRPIITAAFSAGSKLKRKNHDGSATTAGGDSKDEGWIQTTPTACRSGANRRPSSAAQE